LKANEVPAKQLLEGTTIEDYLPLVGELYVRAVADYVAKVMATHGKPPGDLDAHRGEFRKSFREAFDEGKVTKGVAALGLFCWPKTWNPRPATLKSWDCP
jgi:hypothetical protein